jgi:hypothetical protein
LIYTKERIIELVKAVPWREQRCIRLFWVCQNDGSRDELANNLSVMIGSEAVVPLILRSSSFDNANSVLSDVVELFESNQQLIQNINQNAPDYLTVLILAKEDFRLVNASSPIVLPTWFPIQPGMQTFFSIDDLGQSAEVKPLNCPEVRLENIAALLFQLEQTIVTKLQQTYVIAPERVAQFINAVCTGGTKVVDAQPDLVIFEAHISSINAPRTYRPNAGAASKFLAARLLKLVLNSSPKHLAVAAEELGRSLAGSSERELKPTFFAVMWRPANKTELATTNWLAILVGFFQAYQLMNANAHAGDFPSYSVALQYATSVNLRKFLNEANDFVLSLS